MSHLAKRRKLNYIRILGSSIGGFLGIAAIAFLSEFSGASFLMPPFGATCVIAFVIPESAFAQPQNIVGGHLLSSTIGILCYNIFQTHWWSLAIAVGLCIASMQLTKTLHPPAAADPVLILMQGGVPWSFLVTPVLLGSLVLVLLALIYNNLIVNRPYPKKKFIGTQVLEERIKRREDIKIETREVPSEGK
ncbi:HPP family protein [Sporomusa malonica]|uniref:HPP family protein n=1 Tax=Sporomusa malonica TaxID=112901 RepID=A0A1W2EDQ8_9FIRM|nr:HPP family protein [Sporomusa malonica]SMD07849.1 HPP family protein [Sporomusa malonica]